MPESSAAGERSRHLKVRIKDALAEQLSGYAQERELSLSDAVRVLLHESLNPVQLPEEIKVLPAVAFATLLAAEQVNCFFRNHYPKSERDWKLSEEAAEAARKRLQDVELALDEPKRRYRPWDEERSLLGQVRAKVR